MSQRTFCIIDEFTLWPALYQAALGRKLSIVTIRPRLVGFRPILALAVYLLRRFGLARDVQEDLPALKNYVSMDHFANTFVVYTQAESWVNQHFRLFDDQLPPPFDGAYRQATWNHLLHRVGYAVMLQWLAGQGHRFLGFDREVLGFHAAYYGQALPIVPAFLPRLALNTLQAVAFAIAGLAQIALRLRLRPHPKKRVSLLATDTGSASDYELVRLMSDDPGQIVLVGDHRNPAPFPRVSRYCGELAPGQVLPAMAEMLRDMYCLWVARASLVDPELFRRMTPLVIKRQLLRAFFAQNPADAYFYFDEYGEEHWIRTDELHRVGGRALAKMHGLPLTIRGAPVWLYLNLDVFFVYGAHLIDTYFRHRWSPELQVVVVGSLNMPPSQRVRLTQPRPKDIAFFGSVGTRETHLMDQLDKIAAAFPDRKVWVRMKPGGYIEKGYGLVTVQRASQGPANLIYTDENSYELILRCSYALGSISTIMAECIQFGMVTYVFDEAPAEMPFYYRDYPTLCVNTGEEVIDHIRAIEEGREHYPRDAMAPLVDLSGQDPFLALRTAVMGRPLS